MVKLLGTTLCLVSLAVPTPADDTDDKKAVDALIRKTVDKVLKVLKDKELSRKEKREKVMKTIEPVVDFELMAKLSLGRKHWPRLKPEERKQFTELFVETLKASYFEKVDLFSDEVVEFEEPVKQKTKYRMVTYVLSKGERTEVVYKLYKKEATWQVYDFEIEGVSIVRSYGSQYNEFLQESSFEELFAKMREKIETAKKKEEEEEKEEKAESS